MKPNGAAPAATATGTGPAPECGGALAPGAKREKQPEVGAHRFKIITFDNRGGSKSWRVTGTRRDGSRVRENFREQPAALARRTQLEAEFFARAQEDSALRATRLSDTQLRIAETCFLRLDRDEELLLAVEHWRQHGRQTAVAESPRLDEAVEAFLAWVEATESLRPRTKSKYRIRVNLFRKSVPNLPVSEVSAELVDAFLNQRKVSALTRVGDRQAISRFFAWCVDRPRRWAGANPCREVRVEKKADRPPPPILSVEECRKLLQAAKAHKGGELVPYLAVCLFGGLRPAEAQRLAWDKVNLVDGEIRVESQSTKTRAPRVVAVSRTLGAWLKKYKGKPFCPANLRNGLDCLKKKAGYIGRITGQPDPAARPWPHDVLRHTAVSHFFRKTGSYGLTAEQFGNSEAIIKKHYQGRVSSEDTRKFYALLPSRLRGGAEDAQQG